MSKALWPESSFCGLVPHPGGGAVFGLSCDHDPHASLGSGMLRASKARPFRREEGAVRAFLHGRHLTGSAVTPFRVPPLTGWVRGCSGVGMLHNCDARFYSFRPRMEGHSYTALTAFGNLPWVKYLFILLSSSWGYFCFQPGIMRSVSLLAMM